MKIEFELQWSLLFLVYYSFAGLSLSPSSLHSQIYVSLSTLSLKMLETIRKTIFLSFLADWADESAFIKAILETVLPSLSLNLFLVLLPLIIKCKNNIHFYLLNSYLPP